MKMVENSMDWKDAVLQEYGNIAANSGQHAIIAFELEYHLLF